MPIRLSDGVPAARLLTASAVGAAAAAVVVSGGSGLSGSFAPAIGWIAGAITYLCWTWLVIGPMDAAQTAAHATRRGADDSSFHAVELAVVLAALASLAGVEILLSAQSNGGDVLKASVGVLSVICSWLTVHTVFTLRYARLYFPNRDIDFNEPDPAPTYGDFAYVAFTVGMTYQVADTNLKTAQMRRAVLSQALVSFVLGAIILAVTINLVAGLLDLN